MINKKITFALLAVVAAFSLSGCDRNEPLPSSGATESQVTETAAPTLSPTPTPTPAVIKTEWSKPLVIEGRTYIAPYLLMNNVIDKRPAYAFEFKTRIMSKTDKEVLTDEQIEHFFAYCDAVWNYDSETPCKDKDEWKLMNKMAGVYLPMSDFVDMKKYKDLGNGKAAISYKIDQEEFEKKAFDFKLKLAEVIMKAELKEDDPSAVRALKLIRVATEGCSYDHDEKRHYIYDTFMNGNGICSDFAKVLTYLYLQSDVECTYITGGVWELDHHALTAVEQGDKHYFLADLTWELDGRYYTTYWGKTKRDKGEDPERMGGYSSFKLRKAGAAGLADAQDFYNRIDFKDYAPMADNFWSDYNPVDDQISYIGNTAFLSEEQQLTGTYLYIDLFNLIETNTDLTAMVKTLDVKD